MKNANAYESSKIPIESHGTGQIRTENDVTLGH